MTKFNRFQLFDLMISRVLTTMVTDDGSEIEGFINSIEVEDGSGFLFTVGMDSRDFKFELFVNTKVGSERVALVRFDRIRQAS